MPQSQSNTGFGSQPFDMGSWLNSVSNNANNDDPDGNNVSPSQQIQQDVATKAYTKSLQDHAENTPPQVLASLIDRWGQNGGGNVPGVNQGANSSNMTPPQTPGGDINPLVINGNSPQQNQQSQAPSIDDQIAQINKQAALNIASKNLNTSKPATGILDQFGQNVRDLTGMTAARNASNEIVQKIAGAEPLQPKDVGDLNARTYGAALEASHNAAALEVAKLQPLTDLYGKLQATRGYGASIQGVASKQQNQVVDAMKTAGQNLNTHISNLQTLINNRPTFSNKGMDKQSQNTVSKIQEGQTATNPKTGQKIVFKGGKWMNQ